MLGWMRRHGQLELLLVLPDGSKRLIPAAWTSQHGGPDEEAGHAGDGPDLLAASGLVSRFPPAAGRGGAGCTAVACQEDNRAACAAESAAGPGSGATWP